MPTSDLPGIGASMRMGCAASASARSLWSWVIFESFTPSEGFSVNCVTVGPTDTSAISTGMPKCSSVRWITALLCSMSPDVGRWSRFVRSSRGTSTRGWRLRGFGGGGGFSGGGGSFGGGGAGGSW